MSNNKEGKRKLGKRINTYHHLYRRKGIYPFIIKNTIKLIIGLGIFILILIGLKSYLPDFDYAFELITVKFRPLTILIIFFLSESLLGLIPPDFFIIWTQQFKSPYGMVALLAVLSYGGGVISYIIGNYIGHLKRVEQWMFRKFVTHIDQIKRWGGLLIVFAALFPLPFSPVCMTAGMIRFPIPIFLVLALFRLLRFFAYAFILFKVT